MTAEVLIITKMVVALAADSAATVSLGALNKSKTYNSANKLFALSKVSPVGIMIYGNSEIMDIPVEIIIKIYREKLGGRKFDTLKEYYDDFIIFLESFFSEEDQLKYVEKSSSEVFMFIKEEIDKKVLERIENEGILEDKVEEVNLEVSENVINGFHEGLQKQESLPFANNERNFQDIFSRDYRSLIIQKEKEFFEPLKLTDNICEKLFEVMMFIFSKNIYSSTGVVIAGFGENEIFPSVLSFETQCVVSNILKHKDFENYTSIKADGARVLAFAQSDMVSTFTSGIDPALQDFSIRYIENTFNEYSKIVVDEVLKIIDTSIITDTGKSDELKEKLNQIIDEVNEKFNFIDNYKEQMIQFQLNEHYIPILRMVQLLSKSELAEMAEALISITSLKRRVSTQLDTMGGPVDVAIISKGDGFVWIKRKHYFDPKLNSHFFVNYKNLTEDSGLDF